jgi:hypothetical protein
MDTGAKNGIDSLGFSLENGDLCDVMEESTVPNHCGSILMHCIGVFVCNLDFTFQKENDF